MKTILLFFEHLIRHSFTYYHIYCSNNISNVPWTSSNIKEKYVLLNKIALLKQGHLQKDWKLLRDSMHIIHHSIHVCQWLSFINTGGYIGTDIIHNVNSHRDHFVRYGDILKISPTIIWLIKGRFYSPTIFLKFSLKNIYCQICQWKLQYSMILEKGWIFKKTLQIKNISLNSSRLD